MKPKEIKKLVEDLFHPKYECRHCCYCKISCEPPSSELQDYYVCTKKSMEVELTRPACSKKKLIRMDQPRGRVKPGTKFRSPFSLIEPLQKNPTKLKLKVINLKDLTESDE